jgi:Holliday junction resolvasome RuvABC endonuclease subunit
MTAWPPRITSLDLSLTGTGLCHIAGGEVRHLGTIKTKTVAFAKLDPVAALNARCARMRDILGEITAWTARESAEPHLTIVEGPSYGSNSGSQSGHHERAGLWWEVVMQLWRWGLPVAVMTPGQRAKYATGNGGAAKAVVLTAAIKRFGHLADIGDDNQADALVMGCAAADHLGAPLATVPQAHRAVLTAMAWPQLPIDDDITRPAGQNHEGPEHVRAA